MRVRVYHRYYGCDTGCCGHEIELDDGRTEFVFAHPDNNSTEVIKKFAQNLVKTTFGEEHIKDLDWNNCEILDDM